MRKTGATSSLNFAAIFFYFLAINHSFAQKFAFGPTMGSYLSKISNGIAKVRDVVIFPMQPDFAPEIRTIGVFIESFPRSRFNWRADISYFSRYQDFGVYNEIEVCQFCPVLKIELLAIRTLEVSPVARFSLIKHQKFNFGVLAGTSVHLQIKSRDTPIDFGNKHPGVADVMNHLNESVRPLVFYLSYGGFIEYGRFSFFIKQEAAGNSYTEDLNISGQTYQFKNY